MNVKFANKLKKNKIIVFFFFCETQNQIKDFLLVSG